MEIAVNNVKKYYKENKAVDDISFSVRKGEVYGIIGPNGAGKTTLMEMMLGLRRQDSGTITTHGMDSIKDHKKLVYHVGAQLQESDLPVNIKVREAIHLQAALFHKKADTAELLRTFNLEEKAGAYCSRLSGGQRQALTLLMATMNPPKLLLLDEHTAALDPGTAEKVLNLTSRIVEEHHLTCLMITHNMQSALELGNRILMMDSGDIVLDIKEEEKKGLTVEGLLDKFKVGAGKKLDNDRILLSNE
mgnify:CR=1 FL=1